VLALRKFESAVSAPLPSTHHAVHRNNFKEKTMKARLPLTLELANPVLLADFSDFDAKTQLSSATQSSMKSASFNLLGIQVDVSADVLVDDTIA
jgi:hypothetical protein